jgi:hypothetical protein
MFNEAMALLLERVMDPMDPPLYLYWTFKVKVKCNVFD